MSFYARRFNLNLYLLLALLLSGSVVMTGCFSGSSKKKKEFLGTLRVHIENRGTMPDGGGQTVKVLRSQPVEVSISPNSILSEDNMMSVSVVDTPDGGFAIKIKFDETGGWTLEQYSAANPGGHFVIFGQWDKDPSNGRWLAAPLITHHIGDGILVFTPDCSREEADKLAASVNRTIQKIQTGGLKSK